MAMLLVGWLADLAGATVADSNRSTESLVFRSWGTEAGLPQNSVAAMVQTRDGYLWLGTREGLARFDGVHFTVFGLNEGLQSVDVQALLADRQGTLWIGTSGGGLSRFSEGRISNVPLPQRSAAVDSVTALAEDAEGRLWIGTRAGLAVYQAGSFITNQAVLAAKGVPIRTLMTASNGVMWVATSEVGLLECNGPQVTESHGPAGNERIRAYCLLQDRTGNVWASVGNGTVLCQSQGTWLRYGETNGLPFEYVTCLAEEPDGTIWAGSLDHGLFRFANGRFAGVTREDGLSANDIRCLLVDREHNLWVGTRTGGLDRLSRRRLITYGPAQGLTNDYTRSVAETKDGDLWVGTIGGGLYRGVNGQFAPTADEGQEVPRHAFIYAVLATRDGSVWYGGSLGLFRAVDGKIKDRYLTEPWLKWDIVTALCEDPHGGLWIGTSGSSLVHFQDGKFTPFPQRVARGTIGALVLQPDGSLWVGSDVGGLNRIRLGDDKILSITNGLISQDIRTLYADPDGTLWIGSRGGGLSRWRAGKIVNFTTREGMVADTISQIVEDQEGDLWLGCSHGIFRVSKADLEAQAAGRLTQVNPRRFGLNEGMPAEECSSGFCPAGLRTRSGRLCFSTVKGLVLIDPRQQETDRPPPQVLLEEARINGQAQPLTTKPARAVPGNLFSALNSGPLAPATFPRLTTSASASDVEFNYTAISFVAPEKLRFRYRLAGLGTGWDEAGSRRSASYHSIPAGEYVFQVMVCAANSGWSQPVSLLAVTVQPRLWEQNWFRVMAGVTILGVLGGGIRLWERRRYRRRLARLELLNVVERERLRISQDMHDHVGAMLTQVSMASDLGLTDSHSQPLLKGYFERIGDQTRAAVQALDEIVWATNPKNDNLPQFAEYICRFSDECFEFSPIRCWQEVPTNLPNLPLRADVRHNVFSALKEAFNNVLKYSGATEVSLRLEFENAEVRLTVKDNGRGFVSGSPIAGDHGLGNMRTRLAESGGSMELKSVRGEGTSVCLRFPLRPEH